ncbi:MAG: hypothetical protein DRJ60_07335 [Thermoprotei archaeon]|nr:MAG: hypothetical protein DRJ60_07335 [Thermoprotei archaeon]
MAGKLSVRKIIIPFFTLAIALATFMFITSFFHANPECRYLIIKGDSLILITKLPYDKKFNISWINSVSNNCIIEEYQVLDFKTIKLLRIIVFGPTTQSFVSPYPFYEARKLIVNDKVMYELMVDEKMPQIGLIISQRARQNVSIGMLQIPLWKVCDYGEIVTIAPLSDDLAHFLFNVLLASS